VIRGEEIIQGMNQSLDNQGQDRITTALLLAAGTGSRLFPLTQFAPKCLTLVSEQSILDRLITNLKNQGFTRLVIVTGHEQECIVDVLGKKSGSLEIEYIHSANYKTTNNIYSLWLARHRMTEPFVLFESDLVLNSALLDNMVYPNRIAVAKMQPWLQGTTVTIGTNNKVTQFHAGTQDSYSDTRYKTVNIYSFSIATWEQISLRLDAFIQAGQDRCYYENVFAEMVQHEILTLEPVSFDHKNWFEIDTVADLAEAELLFPITVNKVSQPVMELA
jgi:choline kinase